MQRGMFITIEGTEGAGKSTALHYIKNYLEKADHEIIVTREPGGTVIAEEIRKILLYPMNSESIQPETELLLIFAGRAQHISRCIAPALQSGKWVVSDRYIDASYAYQGGGRGMEAYHIKALDKLVVGNLYPDLTILLDVPAEIGFARAEQRNPVRDRIEQEKLDFFHRVRTVYLERAKQDSKRIKIIDASLALPAVQDNIRKVLDDFMDGI